MAYSKKVKKDLNKLALLLASYKGYQPVEENFDFFKTDNTRAKEFLHMAIIAYKFSRSTWG